MQIIQIIRSIFNYSEPEIVAPKSQEPQNFFEQLETAPKFEELLETTQKEIIGNPDNWSKDNIFSAIIPKEEPIILPKEENNNKYFVEFKANIKGNRKEIGLIVETENKDDIPNIISKKIKKEYSGVRTINCVKSRELKENDEEYIVDLTSANTRIVSDTSSKEDNNTNIVENIREDKIKLLDKFFKVIGEEDQKLFKVVVCKNREPKLKDMKNYRFHIEHNERDVINSIMKVAKECNRNDYKEKYIKVIEVSKEDLLNNEYDLNIFYENYNLENIDATKYILHMEKLNNPRVRLLN